MMDRRTPTVIYTWVSPFLQASLSFRSCIEPDSQGYHQSVECASRAQGAVCFPQGAAERSYVPGWDCHGLPIELKALAELNVS
jgi:hypothetical protein